MYGGCDTYISNGYLKLDSQTLGDLLGVGYAYAKFEAWTTETGWMLGEEVLNSQTAEYGKRYGSHQGDCHPQGWIEKDSQDESKGKIEA